MDKEDPQPVIKMRGLTKYYGDIVGIKDLDLDVYPGEILGFLGPNGAGKTTTIRTSRAYLKKTSRGFHPDVRFLPIRAPGSI